MLIMALVLDVHVQSCEQYIEYGSPTCRAGHISLTCATNSVET